MAIISFWSTGRKETGQTLSMAATITSMSIDHNYKVLGISTGFKDTTLLECFFDMTREQQLQNTIANNINSGIAGTPRVQNKIDSGVEGLIKLIQSNRISPNIIGDYTKVVLKNRLDILPAPSANNQEDYYKTVKMYHNIIDLANRDYNLVFVDIDRTMPDDVRRDTMIMSDIIVVNVTQGLKSLNEFMETREKDDLLKKKNVIVLIGRYDKYSKYNSKNITRYLREKKEVSTIPYNTLFFEATTEAQVPDYFLRYKTIHDDTDRNMQFISETKKTCDAIIYKTQELQLRS